MSSLDTLATIGQNLVNTVALLTKAITRGQGTNTSATVTAATLVATGSGRLVSFSVVVPGAAGTINDAATVAAAAASNALCWTPPFPGSSGDSPITPGGIFPVGMIFLNGLVVQPGSGQSVAVTYSLG